MKAIFLRVLEEAEDKSGHLRTAIASRGHAWFETAVADFSRIAGAPLSYWVSNEIRGLFASQSNLRQLGYSVNQGLITADDKRFLRLIWEVEGSRDWSLLAKGSSAGGFATEFSVAARTSGGFRELVESANRKYPYLKGGAAKMLHAIPDLYGPSGLGYTRRTTSRFRTVAVPAGSCFSDKMPLIARAAQQDRDLNLSLLGLTCSSSFAYLLELSLGAADAAARSYETGLVEAVPLPTCFVDGSDPRLAELSRIAHGVRAGILSAVETAKIYRIPALLQVPGQSFSEQVSAWKLLSTESRTELASIQAEIDNRCFELYGIKGTDRQHIEHGLGNALIEGDVDEAGSDKEEDTAEAAEVDPVPLVTSVLSWAFGVAVGRFDLRLATGERQAPSEPEPFDPLPVCSPGMLTGDDGLPLDTPPPGYPVDFPRDGILVDDAGTNRDLVATARQVFERIFDDPAARWIEAAHILDDRGGALRSWFARDFFGLHIKRYSKSRRKAPLYWQLATPSASYSAWLYCHRFTRDTLFRLLNDYVGPKLQHEERKLTNLTQDAGPNPAASQRREIDDQEVFVGELRAFRDEVALVAPLWNPNLHDGVILNFAPLWRLVPQHKAWQKECKAAWDKLCKGDYDWAHLAMHLWPERVVPKCAKDRSLAIAHGLEEVFWCEDQDGKWQPKIVSDEEVEALVAERTSPAVKAALKSLLEAPAPVAGRGRTPRRKKTTTRRAKAAAPSKAPVAPREQSPRQSTSTHIPDDNVLDQVRSAIATLGGNAAKSDILETTGLPASQWTPAINALLADGSITKTGQKRGTRYHLAQDPS